MNRKSIQISLVVVILFFAAPYVGAHCEVPCGIYDDQMRISMIAEHVATIEKAMKEIIDLEGKKPRNYNQLTRWIVNKEHHANALQHIVSQYFMTQRIKFDDKKYSEKLTLLHKMLVYAMKCKQTTDLSHASTLKTLLHEFSGLYFEQGHK